MVYVEAQACGLPVVALDTAGVPQVVSRDETAILVPRDGGKAMADAIERLLSDKALRESLASRGPRFVEEHRNLWRNYVRLSEALDQMPGSRGENG